MIFSIPISPGFSTIELRAVDARTGITSNTVAGSASLPSSDATNGLFGYAWVDTIEDQVLDSNEQSLTGVRAQLVDQEGNPLNLITTVEPDEYAKEVLDDLDGVSLSWISDQQTGSIAVDESEFSSTGDKAFFAFDVFQFFPSWSSSLNRKFKAEFDQPVSHVAIDAVGLVPDSYARIEAYDASGALIHRITSDAIGLRQATTLEISAPGSDIASVIVFGHANTSIALDNLNFGTITASTSDAFGVFSLAGLADGEYQMRIEPPSNAIYEVVDPIVEFSITQGTVASAVPIQVIQTTSPWQNPNSRFDVDDQGSVEPLDILLILNELNRNGSRTLVTEDLGSAILRCQRKRDAYTDRRPERDQ